MINSELHDSLFPYYLKTDRNMIINRVIQGGPVSMTTFVEILERYEDFIYGGGFPHYMHYQTCCELFDVYDEILEYIKKYKEDIRIELESAVKESYVVQNEINNAPCEKSQLRSEITDREKTIRNLIVNLYKEVAESRGLVSARGGCAEGGAPRSTISSTLFVIQRLLGEIDKRSLYINKVDQKTNKLRTYNDNTKVRECILQRLYDFYVKFEKHIEEILKSLKK